MAKSDSMKKEINKFLYFYRFLATVKDMKKKFVGNGILKDITRLIIETDEENPVPIAIIDYNEIQLAKGYRARLKPNYKN